MTVRTIDEIFRDFVTDGVPASGPFNPHKPDIRDTLKALTEGGVNFPDNRVIRLNNSDEGTANNIVVTASVAIPTAAYQVLYILNVTQENTGPVTVSGVINRDLLTNINQPVSAGYLTPGMALLCIDTGTELRLLSYGDAEAIQAAAETAAQRAVDAAEVAENAAGGLLINFASVSEVQATNIPLLVSYLRTAGYYSPGAGGAALYTRVAVEPSHAGKIQSQDGSWWQLSETSVDPRMLGAIGDGVTNNGQLLNDALIVSRSIGATLIIPIGVFICTGISVQNNDKIKGVNRYRSIIRAHSSLSGRGLIEGKGFSTLVGTDTYDTSAGANQVQLANISIEGDGVFAGNLQHGVRVWGYATNIQNVVIKNFSGIGLHTEWTDGVVSMEGTFGNIVIQNVGRSGWSFGGPHDSFAKNIMIIDAGQSSPFGYYQLDIYKGNGRWINIHTWHTSVATNRTSIGCNSKGANEFISCHFEGSKVQLWHRGPFDRVVACLLYAQFGNSGDPLVIFEGSNNIHTACFYDDVYGTVNGPAIQFGTIGQPAAQRNIVSSGQFNEFKQYGPFNFQNSGGFNIVSSCLGHVSSAGGATTFGGTPNVNDRIDYRQTGGTGFNVQKIHYLENYADDATAASAGIPINGLYRTGSLLKVRVT